MPEVLAQEQTVSVKGIDYKLSKMEVPLLQEFAKWSKDVLPNPYLEIKDVIKEFPLELQKIMIKSAQDKAGLRGTLSDPDVTALISTAEGLTKIIALLLRKYNPSLKEVDVDKFILDVAEQYGPKKIFDIFQTASGEVAKDESEIEADFFTKKAGVNLKLEAEVPTEKVGLKS